jgi:hypothetical protein
MMEEEVKRLLVRDPFEPFRIKLVNGDAHDVNAPDFVAILEEGLYIASHDGLWVEFPYDRIASLECLIAFE